MSAIKMVLICSVGRTESVLAFVYVSDADEAIRIAEKAGLKMPKRYRLVGYTDGTARHMAYRRNIKKGQAHVEDLGRMKKLIKATVERARKELGE